MNIPRRGAQLCAPTELETIQKTAVLLIGFGGPRKLDEVQPFLESIVGTARMPGARIKEVYHHYEVIGGASPFNAITDKQKAALEASLKSKGYPMSVGVAYRHSIPTFQDAFESFKKFGVEKVVGFVLASFRSFVSREWYYEKAEEGRKAALAENVSVVYTEPFESNPAYFLAQEERIKEVWSSWSQNEKDQTQIIFTAHSIPTSMCQQSTPQNENRCYGYQFSEACEEIARKLKIKNWTYCYQSRSTPRDLWLEPDVNDVIKALPPSLKNVLLVPLGFLCDNVEVIYDLDIEAKATAEGKGLKYHRAGTVSDHPIFIEMMAEHILKVIS